MPPAIWKHAKGQLVLDRPIVMGILNVTPDSFSDGGQIVTVEQAVDRAAQLVALGADVLDVGGESTRPQGAVSITADEEMERVVPVVRALAERLPKTLLSVDTTKSEVAEAAIHAGAAIVNDVSGFRLDAQMTGVCARHGVGVVLMHSRGGVTDMASYAHAKYDDVVGEVVRELEASVNTARDGGVACESIVLDPG